MLGFVRKIWKARKVVAIAVFVSQLAIACASSGVQRKLGEMFPRDQAAVELVLGDKKLEQKLDQTAQFLLQEEKNFQEARKALYDGLKKMEYQLIGFEGLDKRMLYAALNIPQLFKDYFQSEKRLLEKITALEKLGFGNKAKELRRKVLEARDPQTILDIIERLYHFMFKTPDPRYIPLLGDYVILGLYNVVKESDHQELIAGLQRYVNDTKEYYDQIEIRTGYRPSRIR